MDRIAHAVMLSLVLLLPAVDKVHTLPQYRQRIPNGANVPGVAAVGHLQTQGDGPVNAFGMAFKQAGFQWTKPLCELDSDGDGFTNGEELGDPCCEWTASAGATAKIRLQGLSNPGDRRSAASIHDRASCTTRSEQDLVAAATAAPEAVGTSNRSHAGSINDDKSFDSSASFAIETQIPHTVLDSDVAASSEKDSSAVTTLPPKDGATSETKAKSAATGGVVREGVVTVGCILAGALVSWN